jgi:hypothetical protein
MCGVVRTCNVYRYTLSWFPQLSPEIQSWIFLLKIDTKYWYKITGTLRAIIKLIGRYRTHPPSSPNSLKIPIRAVRTYNKFEYWHIYFLNFLLNPANPTNPVPKRSMVAGSGTGAELERASTVIDDFDQDTSCCRRSVLFPIWYIRTLETNRLYRSFYFFRFVYPGPLLQRHDIFGLYLFVYIYHFLASFMTSLIFFWTLQARIRS